MVSSILTAEHHDLLQSALDLTAQLGVARGRLVPTEDVTHQQHAEFGERTWSLHVYLQSALSLLDDDFYMPAFTTLRAALEHHVQDHLLFLGNRYKAAAQDVSDETLAEWQQAIAEGREDFKGILAVRRVGGDRVEVVRSGPHYTGGDQGPGAPGLSIYYNIVFDRYDPFTGGKKAQDFIGQWPHSADAHQRWAAQAAETWGRFLTWRQLMANLRLNEFYTERELAQLEVHYSFLSAFTHPAVRGLKAVLGRNMPTGLHYDHYVSELILLYVITLARLELEVFEEMTRREPVVNLAGWNEVRTDIERGESLASHLWFPRGSPHEYDRVQEANRRGTTRDGQLVPFAKRPKPEDLANDEILYYANPLRRIIELHCSQHEMTGFPYSSPWHRSDALSRRMD